MDANAPKYFDAKLGKFTVASVFHGEGMGEWTFGKKTGFTLTDSGNSSDGGNYRMAFRFVLHSMIGENRYMRVVYKANNGSAKEPVSLITCSPATGESAVLEAEVQNTDEWTLSGTAYLTGDLFDRLGGTGEYEKNKTFELITQEHNFIAFTNTAPDAEYAVRDAYFFETEADALAFTMPEAEPEKKSCFTVGNAVYDSVNVETAVDSTLADDKYRIFVKNNVLYANGGSKESAEFAKKAAEARVLGYDTYNDVIKTEVPEDFMFEGVYPHSQPTDTVTLKYDDRYTFDKVVAYVDSTEITSKSVITGEADVSVLRRIEGETFAAYGIGTATVYFADGTSAAVTVTPAKLSLVMLAGQSNGEGHSGDHNRSIRSVPGQVYSTYACAGYRYMARVLGYDFNKGIDALSIHNSDVFIPKALTSTESRMGADLTYLPTDLTEGGHGKGGPDSGIAYEWSKTTGEKIWIVNASHSASGIDSWHPGSGKTNNNFWQAVGVFKSAQNTVKEEITAGHYELSRMGYFWLQGCSDANRSSIAYTEKYKNMHEGFKRELAFDHDSNPDTPDVTVEFGAILLVRYGFWQGEPEDIQINGPRMSQYYMGNEKHESWMEDIYLSSVITNRFITDEEAAAFFAEKYGTEENYKAQNNVDFPMPSTVNEVHPSNHYEQPGYNEIGRDAAYNLLRQIGMISSEAADIRIDILDADGHVFDPARGLTLGGGESVILVPDVFPRYIATDVKVECSSNIERDSRWQYTFICADGKAGFVTFRCGDVSVTVKINK